MIREARELPEPSCRVAVTRDDQLDVMTVRQAVFVDEQAIFVGTDRDHHDDAVTTEYLVGEVDGRVVACVRIYPLGDGWWKGDRLAVLREFRTANIGADLVRLAVVTAAERGGDHMTAMIQLANVRFFERLGWRCDGAQVVYAGQPHQPMVIEFPATDDSA